MNCHDCGKPAEIKEEEILNGVIAVYNIDGEKTSFFRCKECFEKSPALTNYQETEVYSRIVGYHRPISQSSVGKQQEYHDRKEYKL